MKKLSQLLIIFLMGSFLACGGGGGGGGATTDPGSNTDPTNPVVKIGKFAVKQMATGMSKSMINMEGGTINASDTQYFILQNIGTADITGVSMQLFSLKAGATEPTSISPDEDFITVSKTTTVDSEGKNVVTIDTNTDGTVKSTINSTNFTSITEGYNLSPNKLTVISPSTEANVIQLIEILISHGTAQSGIGYTNTLPMDVNNTYIVITGISNKEVVQMNIKFSTLIKLAAWTITSGTLTNTGNVPIEIGQTNTGNPLSATCIHHGASHLVIQPGNSYSLGTLGISATYFSIYTYNTVFDYITVSTDTHATISYSGTVVSMQL